MQREQLGKSMPQLGSIPGQYDSMKITVFTSNKCHFCNEAVRVVEETLEGLPFYEPYVDVVEADIDKEPELTENLEILAVPTILVSRVRVIGLPRSEDIEQLIHQEMLALAGKRRKRR